MRLHPPKPKSNDWTAAKRLAEQLGVYGFGHVQHAGRCRFNELNESKNIRKDRCGQQQSLAYVLRRGVEGQFSVSHGPDQTLIVRRVA